MNTDLIPSYGKDFCALTNHYVTHGISEKRLGIWQEPTAEAVAASTSWLADETNSNLISPEPAQATPGVDRIEPFLTPKGAQVQ